MNVTEMRAALQDHGEALTPTEVTAIYNALTEFQEVARIMENLGALVLDLPGHGRFEQLIEGWADFRQLMNIVPRQ